MGLRAAVQGAAQAAIAAVGDVAVSTNYKVFTSTVYNTSTGTQVETFSTVAAVNVVVEEFNQILVDGIRVQSGDRKFLVAAKDIPNVTPKLTDHITLNAEVWRIMDVKTDPAEALWTLHGRRS